jgi:hypothetical protein
MEEGDDDQAFITAPRGDIARSHGMLKLARETGLTREGLYKALSADGNQSVGTVLNTRGVMLVPQVGWTRRGRKHHTQVELTSSAFRPPFSTSWPTQSWLQNSKDWGLNRPSRTLADL